MQLMQNLDLGQKKEQMKSQIESKEKHFKRVGSATKDK